VKPANILLADGVERVKLTDFGLARAADDASLTKTGILAGTPQYMSPEQARGESVDQRSDLFSLGSVLYAMCTGRAPFRAETSYGVLRRITDEEPRPIRQLNPDIPDWLCRIIARLMSKQPADRFESAREVAELLEECLAHVQQPTAVPLPASLEPLCRGSRFFSTSLRSLGVIAMIAAGLCALSMFLWPTDPPEIGGRWTGEGWGQVVLREQKPGKYEGTYNDPFGEEPGKLTLEWSRVERRFNGTWTGAKDRSGKISVRLVDDEIRGACTTRRTSGINPGTPELADLSWRRAAETRHAKPQLRVLDANGNSVADNQVIRGTKGYPGPTLPSWSETPSHRGVISLDKLAAGTHWLLVRGNPPTVLRLELPAAEEMIERRLRPRPGLVGMNLDVKVAVEDSVEFIRIEIHNRTTGTIKLTEADLELMTAIKEPGADAHVLSPLWSKLAVGEALPETTIEPGQTATLRLNWADWVRHGFWFSRDGEVIAEPSFPEREAGKTWVRVTLGSAMPVSVTHPDRIVSRGDDKRDSAASRSPPTQLAEPQPETTTAVAKRLHHFTALTTGWNITIAYSADGRLLAVANGNPTRIGSGVKDNWKPSTDILDVDTGKTVISPRLTTDDEDTVLAATKRVPHFEVTALAFSPDGNLMAVGTSVGQVKLFNPRTGELLRSLDDQREKLADKKTPENLKSLTRAMGGVTSLAFSPDGSLLAVCGRSFADSPLVWESVERAYEFTTGPGRLKLWEVKTGTLKHDLVGHSHANAACFSPDGKLLASAGRCSGQSGVVIWNPHTGAKIRTIPTNDNGGIRSVAFSPDSKLLAIGSQRFDRDKVKGASTGAVSLAHVSSGIVDWLQTVPGWAKPVAFSPDGKSVVVLCGGPSIRFLETEAGRVRHEIRPADSPQREQWNDFAIAPQPHMLAIAAVDNVQKGSVEIVEIWDSDGSGTAANSAPVKDGEN
jgi:dipeptidyl aminopeptidase/acylaminoacyl peptidase